MPNHRVSQARAQKRLDKDNRRIKILAWSKMSEPATFECERGHVFVAGASNVVNTGYGCNKCRKEYYRHSDLTKQKIGAGNKQAWSVPSTREYRLDSIRAPETSAKKANEMRKAWRNPETREMRVKAMNKPKTRKKLQECAQGWMADGWIAKGVEELYLYIVEFIGIGLFKIGITQDPQRRYKQFPHQVKILAEIKGSTRAICDMEKELKRQHKSYKVRGKSLLAEFRGGTEVFSELVGYSIS